MSSTVVRGQVPVEAIPGFLGEAYDEVMRVLAEQGQSPAGPPFGCYQRDGSGFTVEAGFPTRDSVRPAGRVQAASLPSGLTARLLYRGDYAGIGAAHEDMEAWLDDHGYVPSGLPWESYLDEPGVAQPRTVLQMPCVPRASTPGDEAGEHSGGEGDAVLGKAAG